MSLAAAVWSLLGFDRGTPSWLPFAGAVVDVSTGCSNVSQADPPTAVAGVKAASEAVKSPQVHEAAPATSALAWISSLPFLRNVMCGKLCGAHRMESGIAWPWNMAARHLGIACGGDLNH